MTHLLKTKQDIDHVMAKTKRIRKLRQSSILKMGVSFIPFTLFSPQREKYMLDVCLRQGCAMKVLVDRVLICPVHLTIHRCNETTCSTLFPSDNQQNCVLSMRSLKTDAPIVDDAFLNGTFDRENTGWNPSQVVSYSRSSNRQATHRENEWYTREQSFKKVVVDVVAKLCNTPYRKKYNNIIARMKGASQNGTLKMLPACDVGTLVLLERDVTKLCMSVLKGAAKRKSRKFLLEHAQSFIFVALKTFLSGLCESGTFLICPPHYTQKLMPLPKRKFMAKYFYLDLPKFSKCLKHTQKIYEDRIFRSFLQESFSSGK